MSKIFARIINISKQKLNCTIKINNEILISNAVIVPHILFLRFFSNTIIVLIFFSWLRFFPEFPEALLERKEPALPINKTTGLNIVAAKKH